MARSKKPDPAIGDGAEKSKPLVVGIGASAGGIQALSEFFSNVDPHSGIAYVVILHLSPEHESRLAQVLQQVTKMPVAQVNKQTLIEPDHVYVVPPDKSMTMEADTIVLKSIETVEERRAPVDIFFRTLAETHGSGAVGVVLSGTGANGSMGLKRIKEFGGVTFVQDPREAEFNEMPRNSIATELVDMILPVAEIPKHIVKYRDRISSIKIPEDAADRPEDLQTSLREIFTQLRLRTGHDFSNYKRPTILRRIERRISVKNLPDLSAYAGHLREHPDESNALLRDLLISVTNFFRDKKAFEALEKEIFPKLLDSASPTRPIRIWVAGCATGEEAYSLAMIAAEQTSGILELPPVQIFATDIDERAIAVAREGIYTLNDAADVSPERLRRFFIKEGNNYRVRREIRETVLFAQHNLLKDPPFSHLGLVACRNLLIYLNHTAQERVMETIHFALRPGGYLFIGSSESVDGAGDLFKPVNKENYIFQSRQVTTRPLPVPESVPIYRANVPPGEPAAKTDGLKRITYNDLHLRLVEEFAPPSVVVNQNYDIVHVSQRAGKYLTVTGGEPTNNLLRLIRPEIRLEVRTAMFQALQQKGNVEVKNLRINLGGHEETINLLVRPVTGETDTERGFILVVFEPAESNGREQTYEYAASEPVARQLEEELVRSRTQLQSSLEQSEVQSEELRASNEELQAMNEELRSSAEELETGKEELQSINEELSTVNQELKIKIEELSHSNNDFTNLLNSIDIGVIFLDRSLRVNLYSPAALEIFNLIPNDVGRELTDITHKLEYTHLAKDADKVLETLQTAEREVATIDHRIFAMKIFPYRTGEDRINGVVITFIDFTQRRRSAEALRRSELRLQSIANLVPGLLWDSEPDGSINWFNQRWMEYSGQTLEEAVGWGWTAAIHPDDREAATYRYREAITQGERLTHEYRIRRHDGVYRWFVVHAFPLKNEKGKVIKMYGVATDIHDLRVAMEALRSSEERVRTLMNAFTDIALFTTDPESIITAWNPGSEKIFGYAAEEVIGKQSADIVFTPEDREEGVPGKERRNAVRDGKALDERWHIRKNGERFYASGFMVPLLDGKKLYGFGKIAQDLTERGRGEQAIRERAMLKRLVAAQEQERQRIARDIHDHLGQSLTALRLKIEGLKANYGGEPAMIKALDDTQLQAKKIDDDVSFMSWQLRPTVLDTLGLRNALGTFVNEWSNNFGIEAEFHSARNRRTRLLPEIEINLYRIAQEALNNVLKHARASKVDVMLEYGKEDVVLIVEDNGTGFDTKFASRQSERAQRLGLIGMRERAALLGGTLEIESARSTGTTIIARVPAQPVDGKRTREKKKEG